MTVHMLPAFRDWYCPNCKLQDRAPASVQNRYHNCRALRGLYAPMLPAGVKAKVTAHQPEDYVGADRQAFDEDGRPFYLVQTTRDEGQDAVVFPAAARAGAQA